MFVEKMKPRIHAAQSSLFKEVKISVATISDSQIVTHEQWKICG